LEIIFTKHAIFEMERRKITKEEITYVLNDYQQKIHYKGDKIIFQSKYYDKNIGKDMLLRIIAKETEKGIVIITAYKTSKVKKYWQNQGGI